MSSFLLIRMFKKEAAKKKKEASKKKESMPSSVHPSASSYSPAVLNEMRIVQRNLVYVIGLAPYLAVEEVLYFTILKFN